MPHILHRGIRGAEIVDTNLHTFGAYPGKYFEVVAEIVVCLSLVEFNDKSVRIDLFLFGDSEDGIEEIMIPQRERRKIEAK